MSIDRGQLVIHLIRSQFQCLHHGVLRRRERTCDRIARRTELFLNLCAKGIDLLLHERLVPAISSPLHL